MKGDSELTLKRAGGALCVLDGGVQKRLRVLRHERDETHAGRVERRMRQVPVVEHNHVALQERVTEVPAEQRADARRVRADNVARDAVRSVALLVLCDEVARVDREELPANLERQVMALVTWEERRRGRICSVCWRDG